MNVHHPFLTEKVLPELGGENHVLSQNGQVAGVLLESGRGHRARGVAGPHLCSREPQPVR